MTPWLVLLASAPALAAAPPCSPDDLATRAVPGACLTPLVLACKPPVAVHREAAPPLPLPAKETRDTRSSVPYVLETDNFAVKWGAYRGFEDADVQAIAAAFELAWATEVVEMGYPTPAGSERYRFNVYVGDTAGMPSSYGSSGYYYTDDAGYPMIVVSASILKNHEWSAVTAAHELFHALQDAAATYAYTGQGAWYWEAGASWVETEVYPAHEDAAVFLFGTAFLPELPINFFQYPDGTTEGYHQYGAFIFLRDLTEHVTDREIVRRSWVEAPSGGDPMVVLDELLAEEGLNVREVYFDYAARSATFDYEHEDRYEAAVERYGGWSSPSSHRPSGEIGALSDAWHEPAEHLPRTFGTNYWTLDVDGPVEIAFEGDEGPDWAVVIATQTGDQHDRVPIVLDDGAGSIVLDGLDADEAWIVVAAADGTVDEGDAWSYRLRVDAADVPEPDTDDGDTDVELRGRVACGCVAGGVPGGVAGGARSVIGRHKGALGTPWPLLAVVLLRRRRRGIVKR